MSDETPVEQPGGRMTKDDLVRRLTHVAGELHDCPMCEPHAEAIEAAAAAIAGRPAVAPPADLVARLREEGRALLRMRPSGYDYAGSLLVEAADAIAAAPPADNEAEDTRCDIFQQLGPKHWQRCTKPRDHDGECDLPDQPPAVLAAPPAAPSADACQHGHTTRQSGCVSCGLLFAHSRYAADAANLQGVDGRRQGRGARNIGDAYLKIW